MPVKKLLFACLALFLVQLQSCNEVLGIRRGKPFPQACSYNSDCAPSEVCILDHCGPTCLGDRDCPAGQRCLKSDVATGCAESAVTACTLECAEPLVCSGNVCRISCLENQDCLLDQACVANVCKGLDPGHDLPNSHVSPPTAQGTGGLTNTPSPNQELEGGSPGTSVLAVGGQAGAGVHGEGGTQSRDGQVVTGGAASGGAASSEAASGGAGGDVTEPAKPACIVFVSGASGSDSHQGDTWTSALASVSAALDKAEQRANSEGTSCEVWVAAGVYTPAATDRSATFRLRPHVALYGGFSGSERYRHERRWLSNVTTLSGKVVLQDQSSQETKSTLVFHVVTGANLAILDGFTVSDGRTSFDTPDQDGAGLLSGESAPIIRNCIFHNNYSVREGGAIYGTEPLTLINVAFFNNHADFDGGAVEIPRLTCINCIFQSNIAVGIGGAVYSHGANLVHCTFIDNHSAITADPVVDAIVLNSILFKNDHTMAPYAPSVSASCLDYAAQGYGNIREDSTVLDQNLRLSPSSNCINRADPALIPTDKLDLDEDGDLDEPIPFDFEGNPRIVGSAPDPGAYELQP